MSRDQQRSARLRHAAIGAALAIACGLLLRFMPSQGGGSLGDGLIFASYDQAVTALPDVRADHVILLLMDDASYEALRQEWKSGWDRGLHARLVNELAAAGCSLVVFDVFFKETGSPATNAVLARSMTEHGRVVLAGDIQSHKKSGSGEVEGNETLRIVPPMEPFLAAVGTNWGASGVDRRYDGVVRVHYAGRPMEPSLHWAAARLAGAAVTTNGSNRMAERWLRYYGSYGTIQGMSYHLALTRQDFFRDKIVFIGGKPTTRFTGEEVDEFATPFTRHGDGAYMPGVEIVATMFLNLLRGDWLERLPGWIEALLLVLCGGLSGFGLAWLRPLRMTLVAAGGFVVAALIGITLPQWTNLWFPWLLVGAAQIPCAWAWSVLAHAQWLSREKARLERKMARARPPADAPLPALPPAALAGDPLTPDIPDHTLLRRIGKGAFGEVWLARNVVGIYQAVKIVSRHAFSSADPYEREFGGIRRFMPVSLEHPGLVRLLHVGRNDTAAYFYYVMELGDDAADGWQFNPVTYVAKTIESERQQRGYIPVEECVSTGVHLSDALEFLHGHKLVHRDIKPNNIIYVKGVTKLADVGLVTDIRGAEETRTQIGTLGYIAPEGPGTAAADVFSLGMVLYVMCTGKSPSQFPELRTGVADCTVPALFRLNDIILKACEPEVQHRYASAAELRADLLRLQEQLGRLGQ